MPVIEATLAAEGNLKRPSAHSRFRASGKRNYFRADSRGRQKRKRPSQTAQKLKQFPGNYFGGAVGAVVLVPFLLFLPPLWAFLVLVAFLPESAFGVSLVFVAPPVACANARLPASNIVNTTVKSFFMQISFKGKFRVTQSNPILRKSFALATELNNGTITYQPCRCTQQESTLGFPEPSSSQVGPAEGISIASRDLFSLDADLDTGRDILAAGENFLLRQNAV
jgi:hypothetical protein